MLTSDLSSSSVNSQRYSRRPRAPAVAACAILGLVVTSSISPATANPIPFLDFLYPTFHLPSSTLPSSSTLTTSKPSSSRLSSSRQSSATGTAGESSLDERERGKQYQLHSRTNLDPKLSKRATTSGKKVPLKYERADTGWVLAESWDLHGHHRIADVSTLFISYFIIIFGSSRLHAILGTKRASSDDHIIHRHGQPAAITSYLYIISNILLVIFINPDPLYNPRANTHDPLLTGCLPYLFRRCNTNWSRRFTDSKPRYDRFRLQLFIRRRPKR